MASDWLSRAVPVPETPPEAPAAVPTPIAAQPNTAGWMTRAQAIDAPAPQGSAPSAAEALLRGGAQGATMGFSDELQGGGQALFDKILGNDGGKSLGDLYSQYTDEARAANAAAQAAHPVLYGAGNVAGGVGSGILTGGLGAETALGRVAVGAGMGAASGVGYGNAQDVNSGASDALKGALLGGAVSSAVEGVTSALHPDSLESFANNARVRSLNPNSSQYKRILANEGRYASAAENVPGDVASVSSSNATEVPLSNVNPIGTRDSIGQTMKDNKIGGVFSSLQDKLDQFSALSETAGKNIEGTMSALDQAGVPAFSPAALAQDIVDKFAAPIEGFKSKKSAYDAIVDLADDIKNNFQGDDFQTAQKIKNFVKSQTNFDSTRSQTTNDLLKQVYGAVKTRMEQAVDAGAETVGDPEMLSEYLKNKRDYGNAEVAGGILDGSAAREAANQRFGLGSKVVAAGELAAGNPIKAAATAGLMKGAALYGRNAEAAAADGLATGMRWGADKIADIVQSNPKLLGSWAPMLQAAATRGNTSLAATNLILSQTSQAYREHMKNLFDNQGNGK